MSTEQQRQAWRELAASNDNHTWGVKFRNEAITALLADVERLTQHAGMATDTTKLGDAMLEAARLRHERDDLAAELATVRVQLATTTDERDEEWATNQLGL